MNYFNIMQEYLEKKPSLQTVPVHKKAPFIKEWQTIDVTSEVIEAWEEAHLGHADGFGLRAGQHNIGWADIDTDDVEHIHRVDETLDISQICVKKGKKGKTIFFRYEGEAPFSKKNIYLRKGDKKPVVEIFLTTGQTVLPPSIHPDTGTSYKWLTNSLLDLDIEDLPILNLEKIEFLEQILQANSFQEGIKEVPTSIVGDGTGKWKTITSEAARLLHLGIDESTIARTLVGYDRQLFSLDQFFFSSKIGKDLVSKTNDIENATMWISTFKNSLLRQDADLRKTLSSITRVKDAVETHGEWTMPIPLVSKKKILEFPQHLLPDALKQYCLDHSAQTSLPPEAYLMALMTTLASTFQAKVYIHARPNFTVHPSIATMLVAPSGSKKDAVFSAAMEPLRKIIDVMFDAIDANFIENERNTIEEIKQLNIKKNKAIAEKNNDLRDSFSKEIIELQGKLTTIKKSKPNFIFESGTQEKLYEIMDANQDRGILVLASEYVALLGGLAKKGNEGLRGFYLKLLNGFTKESFSHQTKTGTNVNIRKVTGCALVGAQTDVLAKDIKEMEAGRQSDGLLQRFFMIAVNPVIKRMEKVSVEIDSTRVDNLFHLMFHHNGKVDVFWEPDAEDAYLDYDYELNRKIEFDRSVIKSFRAKYSGSSVKLAYIYELCNSLPGRIPNKISKKSFLLAVELLEWLSRNLDVVWDNANYNSALRSAEIILLSIKAGGVRDNQFQTDIMKNTRLGMIDFDLGVNLLIENNYLRKTGNKYEINPAVL